MFLSVVYAWMTEGATEESKKNFDAQLDKPPAGAKPEEVAAAMDMQTAGTDFLAQFAARGGKVGQLGGARTSVTGTKVV